MKHLFKTILGSFCASDLLWPVLRPCLSLARVVASQRGLALQHHARQKLGIPAIIQAGPFKGMIYPESAAHGSALMAKLLGTYENEIAAAITTLLSPQTRLVVDVGAAEGYYAVGFALRCPQAMIHAYDTAEEARRLCQQMAEANGVIDRVKVHSLCGTQDLMALPDQSGTVIIIDCEGGEVGLVTPEVAGHLKRAHFVVECHDHLVPGAFETVRTALQSTHHLEVVSSIPDSQKAHVYRSPLVADDEPDEVLSHVFGEGRSVIMRWIIASPAS